MKFNLIDKDNWKRDPYFRQFMNIVRCSYSMTANIDITNLIKEVKENKIKVYPVLIYMASKIVNSHEEFRTDFNKEGRLGYWESINPCYTVFHKETETFSNIWTEYSSDFKIFYRNYLNDIENFGDIQKYIAKENEEGNTFPVSSIPWTSFTGFNLNIYEEGRYLLPIITFGKYFEQGDKIMLPISLQVHHAVCDGYHGSRFFSEFQELALDYSSWLNY
ncbi:type A chloramphenicol O-acetyltransferase [Haloimpatiens sp. FM7315]|uniref:type A chloramphenicol O-acetyltransferase n=1 Tax=Haloimpatiens sp. FM7315 TaxID=3298609 RepID=UPI0035A32FD1